MFVKDLSPTSFASQDRLAQSSELRSPAVAVKAKTVTQEQINELHKAFSARFGGNKEDYFGVAYIANKFNIEPELILSNIAFGGTEFGIDGYYNDMPNKTLYLFTFRWSADHMSFKDALDKLSRRGVEKIFHNVSKAPDDPHMITSLKTELFQNWKAIDKVVIDFVFNGDPVDAEQSKVLSFLRESFEDKSGIIDSYFSRVDDPDHLQLFRYVSNQRSFGHTSSSRESVEYTLELAETFKISGNQNEMMVAMLPLGALHQMYSDLGERFFEKNIRSGLDDGSMTNQHIKKSLGRIISGEEPVGNFPLYHNGITLTAQRLESNGMQLRMVEPRVLNGAQTIKILKQFVDEQEEKENRKNEKKQSSNAISLREGLASTKMMARIIKSSDNDFLKKVTINNNRQNPIMPWNLRANDLIQVGFEELFAKLGIYYERRENAHKNLTDEDLEAVGTEKGVIEIRKFAQTLLAMQGQIDRISEMKEVFENEAWYSDTFKERYLDVDPRKFVLLYKVQFRLPTVMREIRNIGSEKYGFISKARDLLWCLSLHGLLNDSKFTKYVEKYGNSTGIEAGVAELLKTTAKSKLRFILSDTLEDKKYQAKIADGKMSFLNTKALLNDCMQRARARFGWEKMYL